jgi:hypothetical protein
MACYSYIIFVTILIVSLTTVFSKENINNGSEIENKIKNRIEQNNPTSTGKSKGSDFKNQKTMLNLYDYQNRIIQHTICNADTCAKPNYCVSSKVCKCTGDYITYNIKNEQNIYAYCNYKRRRQLTALLVEIIIPIGFGHFYSGRMLCGLIKFMTYIIVGLYCLKVYWSGYPKVFTDNKKSTFDEIINFMLATLFLSAISIWHLFDLYMFFSNKYYDGNGVSLVPFR